MANTTGSLGFDPRSQEEILAERTRQRAALTLQAAQNVGVTSPADRSAANVGGMLAIALGQKFNPAQLSKAEQREVTIKNRANTLFTDTLTKANAEGKTLSDEDKALELQKAAANAYFESGDYDKYNSLMLDAAQKERARTMAVSQQQLLDSEVQNAPDKRALLLGERDQMEAGKSMPIVIPDENGHYNFDNPTPIMGRLQTNGDMDVFQNDGSASSHQQWIPYDAVLDMARLRHARATAGGKWDLNDVFKPDEIRDARAQARNVQQTAETVNTVTDIVSNALKKGQNPDEIFGNAGKITAFVDNMRSTIGSIKSYTSQILDEKGNILVSGDLSKPQEVARLLDSDPKIAAAYNSIAVPPTMKNAVEIAQYKGAVVQLAYSVWRTMEGEGSRTASNQDYANALDRIGASAGNPRTMLSSVFNILDQGVSRMDIMRRQYRDIGSSQGFDPDNVETFLFGKEAGPARDALMNAQNKIHGVLTGIKPQQVSTDTPPEGAIITEYVKDPETGRFVRKQ